MSAPYLHLDPFLSPGEADTMLRIAESFGSFGTYADEATSDGLGENLPQRFDAGLNYFEHGLDGQGNRDDAETAASRTNYFRETYAYGDEVQAPGVEAFMNHQQMRASAREFSDAAHIVPAIVYANLFVPGQELAIHTDVPEFHGVSRRNVPQWLLVCMLHSGLFEGWRIPIMTCVSWYGVAGGGGFAFYPDGAGGARQSISARHNSAVLLDTDRVFHGVERVAPRVAQLPPIGKQTRLHFAGGDQWELREADTRLAAYTWDELRYSVSWKCYCFQGDNDLADWREGRRQLDVAVILDTLEQSLRDRGALSGPRPDANEFAMLLVRTFIRFPESGVSAQA